MNLSEDEKRVLSIVTLESQISVHGLAQKLRLREHRVRYILQKLSDHGVYYSYPFINFHVLGYQEFNLLIAVNGGKGAARQRLLARLKNSPSVRHMSVTGGEYHIDVQILARSLNILREDLDNLARDCADIDYQIDTLLMGSITYFAANFLGVGPICEDFVVIGPATENLSVDELDMCIIQGLFKQKLPNFSLLAKSVGVSNSTLQSRVERLMDRGVLIRMGYMLDHLKLGFTHVNLLLKAKRPSTQLADNLRAFCVKSRAPCFLIECYGSWDYQVGLMLEDPTRLSGFVDLIVEHLGDQIIRVVPVPNLGYYGGGAT